MQKTSTFNPRELNITLAGETYALPNLLLALFVMLVAVIGTPLYLYHYGLNWGLVWGYLAFHFISGFSVTAGYHRLFSHRTYQASWPVRLFFALGGAMAIQNSILEWAAQHRMHHRHVDDPVKDPYPITKGFFYAHIGWIFKSLQHLQMPKSIVHDLEQDWVVQFQHKYYWPLVAVFNIIIPLAIGFALGYPFGFFLVCVVFRLFVVENVIFSVNSFNHMFGRQPFSDACTARDNTLINILMLGEGYHNYHHRFEYDYRNGVSLLAIDPTKWLIGTLNMLGLANGLRRVPLSQITAARTAMALKRAQTKGKARFLDAHPRLESLRQDMIKHIQHWEDLLDEKKRLIKEQLANRSDQQVTAQLRLKLEELREKLTVAKAEWQAKREQFQHALHAVAA